MKIMDWARLEELIELQGFHSLQEVLTYCIRAQYSMQSRKAELLAKNRENPSPEHTAELAALG